MKTQAEKYSEAVTALTHRLTTWGVDDPETKARDFIHAMACQGWRTTSVVAVPPPAPKPAPAETREQALAAARQALAATRTTPPETEETAHG